jgi:thiol:disulfide interchange protein
MPRDDRHFLNRSPALFRNLSFALLVCFALVTAAHAQEQDGLLPVEQAYVLKADLVAPDRIALHWQIAKDYYLYKGRIKAKSSQSGLTLGELDLPKGIEKHDEFFGDVEIYHDSIEASLPFALDDAAAQTVDVTITVQGCHETDPKICYPPHPVKLSLVREAIAATPASPLAEKFGAGPAFGSAVDTLDADEALPPEQAFVFEAIEMSPTEILARWTMPKGYYLYRDKSHVSIADGRDVELGAPQWPTGIDHSDEHFGTVVVYYNQVELPIALRRADGKPQTVRLQGEFQGCKENGICYPVMQRTVAVDLDPASVDELASAAKAFVPAAAPTTEARAADASADNALRSQPPSSASVGIFGALLFAFLGGIVLNLMPCVLPVLSFKVIGLAQSGESLAKARSHALWYTSGVLVSFAVIGLLVISLRTAGQALGWGFQLQQPGFVAVLVYVLLAVGLSLSGVFTIGAGLAGSGQALASKSGPAGDFFTGVLACIVASPCTAPFMGPALVFAFASSSIVALLIFLALGLGLALPFLLVGFIPALASRLPKPGAWMETFKQVLAFPMYLTAVWLVWVLGKQRGVDAIGLVLAGGVVLALALWWMERARWAGKPVARVVAVMVLLASLIPIIMIARLDPPARSGIESGSAIAYSKDKLAALRADKRTVFVNMTADWCVTCKANERSVLGNADFEAQLARANAIYMKGDWTNVDPEITAFLQAHDAVGVPLYVVFHGSEDNGKVLPTVLTSGIVEAALFPAAQ